MAREISGTFTTTGRSATFTSRSALIILDFAGTATVTADVSVDGGSTWYTLDDGTFTADAVKAMDLGAIALFSLNCSAHTNDVTYYARPDARGRA